ncbi:hypothetical protein [Bradyrhizobium neotropicale]|uniref:hypothetical protein n=1 Tax=Bradyrhizobium neotropicale TaxID=1497615 RepID=UPI001AD732CA|nr:hypothetical protein [Bradyrhizobium neotropicale]MBO4224720.1 hypothetical protein [Bradyrhizobium neotropicale]
MRATEVISISISVIALVLSILSVALQYSVRDDLKFKITEPSFVSLKPASPNPRTAAITFNLIVYNLGNRSAALEQLSLGLDAGKYEEYEKSPPTSCKQRPDRILVPITRSDYTQLGIASIVISKETIFTDQFVFDLFFYEREELKLEAEGLLCLAVGFSNSRGENKQVSAPVGIIKVDLERPDQMNINFSTDQFKGLQTLTTVF